MIGLLLLIGIGSAADFGKYGTGYMTPFFDPATVSNVTYNTSVQFMTTDMTPIWSYILMVFIGIFFFTLSLIFSSYKQFNNVDGICAMISIFPFFISALTSNYVASTDSYGVVAVQGPITKLYDVISMQQVNVWQLDLVTYMWWFMFVVAILNLIRIIVEHGRAAIDEAAQRRIS
jgi:hypothetical protein